MQRLHKVFLHKKILWVEMDAYWFLVIKSTINSGECFEAFFCGCIPTEKNQSIFNRKSYPFKNIAILVALLFYFWFHLFSEIFQLDANLQSYYCRFINFECQQSIFCWLLHWNKVCQRNGTWFNLATWICDFLNCQRSSDSLGLLSKSFTYSKALFLHHSQS